MSLFVSFSIFLSPFIPCLPVTLLNVSFLPLCLLQFQSMSLCNLSFVFLSVSFFCFLSLSSLDPVESLLFRSLFYFSSPTFYETSYFLVFDHRYLKSNLLLFLVCVHICIYTFPDLCNGVLQMLCLSTCPCGHMPF